MHANAFGVFLTPDQIDNIRNYFDTHLNSTVFTDVVYEVDYWFHTGETIDCDMLYEIASHNELWGNSIPQPKFAIDLNYTADEIRVMGTDNLSLKISRDGVDFVAFKCKDLITQLQAQPQGHITIVGRPQLNEWMGRKKVQIMIDDIEVSNAQNTAATITINDLI